MSNLYDFSDVDPIAAKEERPLIISGGPERGKPLGFLASGNRDGVILIVQRNRHPYEDGKQHYYRKLGGYSFPERDIKQMQKAGVSTLVIEEVDNDRVLEFDFAQYRNGEYAGHIDGDKQIGVPVEEAKYTWTADEAAIISKNRKNATRAKTQS